MTTQLTRMIGSRNLCLDNEKIVALIDPTNFGRSIAGMSKKDAEWLRIVFGILLEPRANEKTNPSRAFAKYFYMLPEAVVILSDSILNDSVIRLSLGVELGDKISLSKCDCIELAQRVTLRSSDIHPLDILET